MRRLLRIGLAALVLAMPSAAGAYHLVHSDPRDAPDGFDIQRTRLRAPEDDLVGKVVFFEIEYGYWDWDLKVRFDSRGNDRTDYFALITGRIDYGGDGSADLYRRGGRLVEQILYSFDSAEGVLRFHFPEELLNATHDVRWRWEIDSYDQKDGVGDLDLAPDAGWYDH